MTTARFSQEVEKIAYENSMNYIDAIVFYCEKNGIEIETVIAVVAMFIT